MTSRKNALCIASGLAMVIIILDSRTAFRGAEQGINLCIRTLIPSLFPFLFLSNIISGGAANYKFLAPFAKIFGIHPNVSQIMIPTILGGYPIGAQSIHHLYEHQTIHRQTAEKLLSFCSNIGPSFIFGVLSLKFAERSTVFSIWLIQLLSAWSVSKLVKLNWDNCQKTGVPSQNRKRPMEAAIYAMALICGWVILFRIVIFFLERWLLWILPMDARIFAIGLLDLSNSCCMLDLIENAQTRFILANFLLAFGGICVLLQTASVCGTLSLRYYLFGKTAQALFSVILSIIIVKSFWFLLPIWIAVFQYIGKVPQNKGSILRKCAL